MGETIDQIESDLDEARENLKSNLEELERRAKDAADWRVQFGRHPGAMIAAAVVGGMLLAALMGRR